jgi:hypothetical protein
MIHPHAYRARRGSVVTIVAICLTAILAIVALVLDGGLLLDERRQTQTAADAAALAAAVDLFTNYPAKGGVDASGTAKESALATAKANGFNNDGVTSTVTVNINTSSSSQVKYLAGPNAGNPLPLGYVEVIIEYNEPRFFNGLFGKGSLTVQARAVARGKYTAASPGILILDPTHSNALTTTNTGNIVVRNGGTIIVDSTDPAGASLTNSGNIEAATINLSGSPGYKYSNSGRIVGTINSDVPPTPDPLRNLPEPSQPALPTLPTLSSGSSLPYTTSQGVQWSNGSAGQVLNLSPGYYPGIRSSAGGTIVLNANPDGSPGIYYIGSQGFSITNSTNITGNNVMIYSAGTGDISLTGSGSVTLTPPTSGTYQGISIFQERSSTKQVSITAGGSMNAAGTFYAAAAKMSITNTGDYNNVLGSQYVVYDLDVTGGGGFYIDYAGPNTTPVRTIQLVE